MSTPAALRLARLGHALVEEVPGTALEVRREGGDRTLVAPPGTVGLEVLPCQHRAALAEALAEDSVLRYAGALGLARGGALRWRLVAAPGADLGTGVLAAERGGWRTLVAATTLCAHHAVRAARAAQTVPVVVRRAEEPGADDLSTTLAEMRVEARHDPVLGTTVLRWSHRPHPAAMGPVEDAVRAAAAACVVEELVLDLRAKAA